MNKSHLYLIAISLAAMAVIWTYWQCNSAAKDAQHAADRLERCQSMMAEIEFLQKLNKSSVVIAPMNFDPARSVTSAAENANIPSSKNYSVTQSSVRLFENANVREFRVNIPALQISISQSVSLIRNLAESQMRYQVKSITLTAPTENTAALENWITEFDIRYLKSDSVR